MTEPTFQPYPTVPTTSTEAPEYGSPAHRAQVVASQGFPPAGPTPSGPKRRRPASLLGIGGLVAAVLIAGGAWSGLSELGAVQGTEAAAAAGVPARLVIRADWAAVTILPGDVDRPTFSYRSPWPATKPFTQESDGTTLTARLASPGFPKIQLAPFSRGAELTVTVPRAEPLPEIDVESGTGSIDLTTGARTARLVTSTGSITLNAAVESAQLSTGTGSIDVTTTGTSLTAQTGTGSVTVSDVAITDTLHLSAGTGSVSLTCRTAPANLVLETETGSVDAVLPSGTYAVDTSAGTGDVTDRLTHDHAASHRVSARTATGSISLVEG